MNGKSASVHIIRLVAEKIEHLRIHNGTDKIEGVIRITDDHEQGCFSVSEGVQLQLIVAHQLSQLGNVKGGKSGTAANQDRFSRFASRQLVFAVLLHSKVIRVPRLQLVKHGYNSKDVFGDYIHKYYYNRSIADGYTLKLIREGIKTEYRAKLQSVLEELETQKGSFKKRDVYAHPKYVAALVEYIVDDFKRSRIALNDHSIGAMIVCDSSDQARMVEEELNNYEEFSHVLILHDVDDKETRRGYQDDFKKGKVDILVVYNMLLTGFDAPRLKKQYLGRVIRDHNLLQTLTRVNRPYKSFRYGYVVDFADIRAEFDKTNEAYFRELQAELGDEFERYRDIFKSQEEIEQDLQAIQDKLFMYATDNAELFSQQITALDDKKELLDLRKLLDTYKELFNIIKLFGYEELAQRFSIDTLHAMYRKARSIERMLSQNWYSLGKAQRHAAQLRTRLKDYGNY